jgi:FkbM family methyltransferase
MNYPRCIYQFLKWKVYAPWKTNRHPSYSTTHGQFGEDAFLSKIFPQEKGYYVDIGAHHPVFISNTYHFYKKGWRGINIDATPGIMDIFKAIRPGDVNLEHLVTDDQDHGKKYDFYTFDASSLNSTQLDISEAFDQKPKGKQSLEGASINWILEKNLPPNQKINFLSIDVEGNDEKILRGLDFKKYRPQVILFEDHGDSNTESYLMGLGYKNLATLAVTRMMADGDFYESLPEIFKSHR